MEIRLGSCVTTIHPEKWNTRPYIVDSLHFYRSRGPFKYTTTWEIWERVASSTGIPVDCRCHENRWCRVVMFLCVVHKDPHSTRPILGHLQQKIPNLVFRHDPIFGGSTIYRIFLSKDTQFLSSFRHLHVIILGRFMSSTEKQFQRSCFEQRFDVTWSTADESGSSENHRWDWKQQQQQKKRCWNLLNAVLFEE